MIPDEEVVDFSRIVGNYLDGETASATADHQQWSTTSAGENLALGSAREAAFIQPSTDHRRSPSIDQLLIELLGGQSDTFTDSSWW